MSRILSTNRSSTSANNAASKVDVHATLGGLRRLLMACELDELARTLSLEREQTQPRTLTSGVSTEPSAPMFWPFMRRKA